MIAARRCSGGRLIINYLLAYMNIQLITLRRRAQKKEKHLRDDFSAQLCENFRQSRFLDETVNIARHCCFSARRVWIAFRLLVIK